MPTERNDVTCVIRNQGEALWWTTLFIHVFLALVTGIDIFDGKISSSSVWSCAFSGILSSRHRVILSIQRRWHIDAILLFLLSIIDEGVSEKTKYSALAVFLPILKYGDCLYFAATVNAYSVCHFCCFCKHLDSWQSHLSLDPLTLGSARSQGILKSLEFFAELHAYEHMCILRGHRAK